MPWDTPMIGTGCIGTSCIGVVKLREERLIDLPGVHHRHFVVDQG